MIRAASILATVALLLALPGAAGASYAQHRHAPHGAGLHRRHHARRRHRRHRRRHRHRAHHAHRRHHRRHRRHRHHRHHRRHPAHRAATCPGANLTPTAQNLQLVEAATLCLINSERARHGEQPLTADARLAKAAEGHSRDMVARDYFDHTSPGGQTPLDRIRANGFIPSGHGFQIGENIAWGTLWLATPREIVRAWIASAGHRSNILDRHYRFTGIGIAPAVPSSYAGGQHGAVYTQDFGTVT